jgi:hypothetical protein
MLRSELFISLMQAVLLAGLFELFFGNNYVNPTVVYVGMALSSIGLALGLTLAAARRRGRG